MPGDSIATPARSSETPGSAAIGATTTTTAAAAATAVAATLVVEKDTVDQASVSEEQSWIFQ